MKGRDGKEEEGKWDREGRPRGPAGSSKWGSWAWGLGETTGFPRTSVLEWTEGRKEGKDGGEGPDTGQGVEGGQEKRERGEGRVKKLPGPAYQDLKRPHPSAVLSGWIHQLSGTWHRTVSSPAPRLHIYEAQLITQPQARLLVPATPTCSQPSQAMKAQGSCRPPIYPPTLSPVPFPHPHTHPLPGPALSQGLRPCQPAA